MSPWLRLLTLVALLCAACEAGTPQAGSPGLEPPRGADAGTVLDPEVTGGGTSTPPPSAGSSAPTAGAGGTPTGGAGTSGMVGTGGGGGASGAAGAAGMAGAGGGGGAGAGGAGVSDAGSVPFSEQHETELAKDCQETVLCLQQRGEPLEDDPLAACLEDSAALLDSDERLHDAFLTNVARCQEFVACDYYDCATSPP